MKSQTRRIELIGIYNPFERTPREELSLLDDILHRLGALGLYRENLLYSGFDASGLDDPAVSAPPQLYVMTEADWRETVIDESAMTPPMYAVIAGDSPAIAVIDSERVERNDGSPILGSNFHIPVIPKPEYPGVNQALLAVVILPRPNS